VVSVLVAQIEQGVGMFVKRWRLLFADDFAVKLQSSDLTDLFQVGNPVNLEQNQRWSSLAMGFDSQSCESIWQLGNPVKLAQLRGERAVLYFVLTMFRSIWTTLRLASKSKVKFPCNWLWLAILWVNLTTWQSSQVGKITQETYLIVPCFDNVQMDLSSVAACEQIKGEVP
jgi:hypothetical protein